MLSIPRSGCESFKESRNTKAGSDGLAVQRNNRPRRNCEAWRVKHSRVIRAIVDRCSCLAASHLVALLCFSRLIFAHAAALCSAWPL